MTIEEFNIDNDSIESFLSNDYQTKMTHTHTLTYLCTSVHTHSRPFMFSKCVWFYICSVWYKVIRIGYLVMTGKSTEMLLWVIFIINMTQFIHHPTRFKIISKGYCLNFKWWMKCALWMQKEVVWRRCSWLATTSCPFSNTFSFMTFLSAVNITPSIYRNLF